MDVDVSNSRVQVLDVNDLMRRNGLDRCAFVVIFALIGSEYDGSREGGCATSRVGTGKGSHRPKSGGVRGVGAKTALPAVRALCRIWEAHGFPAVGEEGTFIDFAVHVISQSTAEPDIPVVLSVPATVAATKLEAATLEARGDMSRCRLGSSEAAREDHRQLARTLMALRKQENAGFAETLKTTARGYRREPEPAVVSLAQRAEAAANERDRFLAAQAPSSSSSLATPALFEIQLSPSCGPLTWGRFYAAEVTRTLSSPPGVSLAPPPPRAKARPLVLFLFLSGGVTDERCVHRRPGFQEALACGARMVSPPAHPAGRTHQAHSEHVPQWNGPKNAQHAECRTCL